MKMAKLFYQPDTNYMVSTYPLKEEIDKKIKEFDDKINKMMRALARKAWVGSRKKK